MGFQLPLQLPFQSKQETIHREQLINVNYNVGIRKSIQYNTDYTINVINKTLSINTDYTVHVLNKTFTYNTDYNITINFPYLKLVINDGFNTWVIPTNFIPQPNKKYFVSIAYRSGEQHIYIGDEEGNFTEIAVDNIALSDHIWNGNFKIGCSDTGNQAHAIFDEVLYKPYMASRNEIKSWWALQSPFLDPNNKIDAQSQPVIAGKGAVLINEDGAWGYKNGIKQAGFGTDGTWMAGNGSVKADYNGLDIANGVIIGNENGLKIISPNGDYSTLDSNQIRFFKAEYPDIPYIYSRRVAYGEATSGQKIDLVEETGTPWEYPPKVITTIKRLRSYTGNYSNYDQYYESYADTPTTTDFYVYGYSIVPGQTARRNMNDYLILAYDGNPSDSWVSDYSEVSTMKIRIAIQWAVYAVRGGSASLYLRYRKKGGSWITYKSWTSDFSSDSGDEIFTIVFDSSQVGEYQWGVFASASGDWDDDPRAGALIHWWESEFAGEMIANGEVNWIAIEGGVPPT